MTRTLLVFASMCVAACGGKPDPASRAAAPSAREDSTALVDVDRPTVIGYFRPARDSVDAAEPGYSEGAAHVGFALEDAQACLGRDRAQVALIVDTVVRVRREGHMEPLRFPMPDSLPFGAVLIRPTAEPLVVTAPSPSQLNHAVTEAIPGYFRRPPCGPAA